MGKFPEIRLLQASNWNDYELLDSGGRQKLERFGAYIFIRPEVRAFWQKALSPGEWQSAHAVFVSTGEESGGHWDFQRRVAEKWEMSYSLNLMRNPSSKKQAELKFYAMTTLGRHLGVFPECAAHWDWLTDLITRSERPINVLNLFGYTGLASLAAAASGASVTHVDASKRTIAWARQNQALSGLKEKPIRWIVDDAIKFVKREARREVKYDGIILEPPKFGRGPQGEVWEVYKSLPVLLEACQKVLSEKPLFVILTVYAVQASALHLYYALGETTSGFMGKTECGELVTQEKSAGRLLSQAVYARWKEYELPKIFTADQKSHKGIQKDVKSSKGI